MWWPLEFATALDQDIELDAATTLPQTTHYNPIIQSRLMFDGCVDLLKEGCTLGLP